MSWRSPFWWSWLGWTLGCSLAACAWFKSNEPALGADALKALDCVIEHEGEPPAQEAVTCGLQSAEDVIKLLARMDRRASRKYGSASDGGCK